MQSKQYSFLISVYAKDNPEYLSQAFYCMRNQTCAPDEIVLVCDGPLTDELEMVIAREKAECANVLKVVRLEQNGGLGNALRIGVPECTYELIARMDSDDLISMNRIEKQLEYLNEHPEVGLVGSNAIEFTDNPEIPVAYVVLPETNKQIRDFSRKRCAFRHPAIMFRKEAVLAAGGYSGNYMWFEDTDLYGRMIANGCICHNIQENLLQIRVSGDFFRRRGGVPYIKSMCRVKWQLVKLGVSSKLDFLISAGGQIIVCAMPNSMRETFYKTFLRK